MLPRTYRFSCLILLLLLVGCCHIPDSEHYRNAYAHLEGPIPRHEHVKEPEYYVVFLVAARHFDYQDTSTLLTTMVKKPTDGRKDGSVGHAWILLRGWEEGEEVVIEGGHSGELGVIQPKYAEGVMNLLHYGYLSPTPEEREHPRHEPNPIKYLWASQRDGHFEKKVTHEPTFAAMVPVTEEQFKRVKAFIDPENYPYHDYAITRNQCSNFVAKVGALIDFPIEHQVTIPVDQTMCVMGHEVKLYEDERYREITLSVPDRVERSLIEKVREGEALYALEWYFKKYPERKQNPIARQWEDLCRFPERLQRLILFR